MSGALRVSLSLLGLPDPAACALLAFSTVPCLHPLFLLLEDQALMTVPLPGVYNGQGEGTQFFLFLSGNVVRELAYAMLRKLWFAVPFFSPEIKTRRLAHRADVSFSLERFS